MTSNRTDTANEPVDHVDDGMVDTGVLYERGAHPGGCNDKCTAQAHYLESDA